VKDASQPLSHELAVDNKPLVHQDRIKQHHLERLSEFLQSMILVAILVEFLALEQLIV
jgi:hypothetical protein